MRFRMKIAISLMLVCNLAFSKNGTDKENKKAFDSLVYSKEQKELRRKIVVEKLESLKKCMKNKLFKDCSEKFRVETFVHTHYSVCSQLLKGTEWMLPRQKLPVNSVFNHCIEIFKKISDKDLNADFSKIVTYNGQELKAKDAVNDLIIRHEIDEIIFGISTEEFFKQHLKVVFPSSFKYWKKDSGVEMTDVTEGVFARLLEFRLMDGDSEDRGEFHPVPSVEFFYHFKDLEQGRAPREIKDDDLKTVKIRLTIESDIHFKNYYSLTKGVLYKP